MKKALWITTLLPLAAASVIVQFMPERVPVHYGVSGQADRYGSRYEMLIFPALIAVINIFTWILRMYSFEKKAASAEDDTARVQAQNNAKISGWGGIATAVLLGAMMMVLMFRSAADAKAGAGNLELDSLKLTAILMGILMAVLGNIMPKTRRNDSVGLRISWSMYNDNTWLKSNRYGGRALMAAGVLTVFTALFVRGIAATVMLLVYLTAAVAVSVDHAHKVYDEEKEKEKEKDL